MFFRNQTPKVPSFDERVSTLRAMGFTSQAESSGGTRVTRDGCGAVIKDLSNGTVSVNKAGLLIGGEIALLVNHGYQMFWLSASGKELPAQATHLKALHAFEEDLREGLGLTVLYNQALGTTTDEHLYDRVANRDAHQPVRRPWER